MKKLILALLTVGCLTCLGLAAACGAPNYYKLSYDGYGAEFVSEVLPGAEVKEGYEVKFTIAPEAAFSGVPQVSVNGESLTCDESGTYSFVMRGDSTVKVDGLKAKHKVGLSKEGVIKYFDDSTEASELWVHYYDENGKELDGAVFAETGDAFKFKVKVSPYYLQSGYSVRFNTEVLEEVDGFYTTKEIRDDATISITGLTQDTPFAIRDYDPDVVQGTEENPYVLSRPIDLYYFANLVNDEFYAPETYDCAYYELGADIDMQGEQLFVIGDMMNSTAYFSGHFDGRGHTVSNFKIYDNYIEQSEFTTVRLQYIGFFGAVSASYKDKAEVKNLNLEDFTIEINAAAGGNAFSAGGLAGYAVGTEITGCSAKGKINASADSNYFGYIGGLVGMQQSAFMTVGARDYRYPASTSYCHTDVEIIGESGCVQSAGGVVGSLVSAETKTTAYVINCYAEGNISGAMRAGGVVGTAGMNSSVANCYATGDVIAVNYMLYSDNVDDINMYAHAGGIAGYAENNTVFTGCYSASKEIAAYTPNNDKKDDNGKPYSATGKIFAACEFGGEGFADTYSPVILYAYGDGAAVNAQLFTQTLKWNAADWTFTDGALPTLKKAEEREVTLTLNLGGKKVGGKSGLTLSVTGLSSIADWFEEAAGAEEWYSADDGYRSYGFYFDAELKERVPYGFVPGSDMTLYVGFADYSKVGGRYYIEATALASGAYIELGCDGTLFFRNGAMSKSGIYYYDGESVMLLDTCIANLGYSDEFVNVYYYAFKGTVKDGVLVMSSPEYFPDGLKAYRTLEGFVYGDYALPDGTVYSFKPDLTCNLGGVDGTYVLEGDALTVTRNGAPVTGRFDGTHITLGGRVLVPLDGFAGVWEKSATTNKQYAFDGQGGWTYESFVYDAKGNKNVTESGEGTYAVEGGRALLDNGATVRINADGFLDFDFGDYTETYYAQFSFKGVWLYPDSAEPVEVTLAGISKDGYGNAYLRFGGSLNPVEALYETENANGEVNLLIFVDDVLYGRLAYAKDSGLLSGSLYSEYYGGLGESAILCLYDDFKGAWVSELDGMELLEFNGRGSYDIAGGDGRLAVRGRVTVNGGSAVNYVLDKSLMQGKFTYNGVEYAVAFDETTGNVNIVNKSSSDESVLTGRDIWANVTLISADGSATYTFSGGGNLPSGGVMTVTSGGKTSEYGYKVAADGLIIDGGSLAVDGASDKFVLNLGKNTDLYYLSGFEGEWLISGTLSTLEIEGVGIAPSGVAHGKFKGDDIIFRYDAEEKTVWFDADIEGLLVSMRLELADGELLLYVGGGENYTACIKYASRDAYYGTYTLGSATLKFDGLGFSKNSYGTVIYQSGGKEELYDYEINALGMPVIRQSFKPIEIFAPCAADAERAYMSKDGKYFRRVQPDELYLLEIKDAKDGKITYTFDGAGGARRSDGVVYTYTITESTTAGIKLTFKDGAQKTYSAVVDMSKDEYVCEVTE